MGSIPALATKMFYISLEKFKVHQLIATEFSAPYNYLVCSNRTYYGPINKFFVYSFDLIESDISLMDVGPTTTSQKYLAALNRNFKKRIKSKENTVFIDDLMVDVIEQRPEISVYTRSNTAKNDFKINYGPDTEVSFMSVSHMEEANDIIRAVLKLS